MSSKLRFLFPLVLALSCATSQLSMTAESGKTAPSDGRQVSVVTASDEHISGPLLELASGQLKIGGEQPRSIDLLDVQTLTFNAIAGVSAQWLGQDEHDYVQVGAPLGGNGIQDVHIRLRGLSSQKQIKQIRIVLRTPPRAWLLDPTDSPNWRLFVEQITGSAVADLFMEPPATDLHEKELQLTITYTDDSTDKLTCAATTHTSDKLQMGGKPDDGEKKSEVPNVAVDLGSSIVLHGGLLNLTDDALILQSAWQAEMKIPLLQVQGALFSHSTPDAKKKYEATREKPGTEDLAILTAKDGKLAEIAGQVRGWQQQQLRFTYEGEEHSIAADRLQALVLAARPNKKHDDSAVQIVHLIGGDAACGVLESISADQLTLRTAWGDAWKLPIENIVDVGTRNGNLVYLSDLDPQRVEQTPYFGRLMSYRRDQSLQGGPLKMKGKSYAKGLAVHSRCVLNYDLDSQFTKFKTTVGFDEAAGNRGRVACRVLCDGKELFAKSDLRADQEPQPIEVSLNGGKELSLEIDFGEDEDVGDRVIWADARLFRK